MIDLTYLFIPQGFPLAGVERQREKFRLPPDQLDKMTQSKKSSASTLERDSSAARLHRLLVNGRNIPGDRPCHAAWKELLRTEEETLLSIRIDKVRILINDVTQEFCQSCPCQEVSWLHSVAALQRAFTSLDLNANWSNFINKIDMHSLHYLQFAAETLYRTRTVRVASSEDLGRSRIRLQTILEGILSWDQPMRIKASLAMNLEQVMVSMEEYWLTGSWVMLDAIRVCAGEAMINAEYGSFMTETPLGRELQQTLIEAAGHVVYDPAANGFRHLRH